MGKIKVNKCVLACEIAVNKLGHVTRISAGCIMQIRTNGPSGKNANSNSIMYTRDKNKLHSYFPTPYFLQNALLVQSELHKSVGIKNKCM